MADKEATPKTPCLRRRRRRVRETARRSRARFGQGGVCRQRSLRAARIFSAKLFRVHPRFGGPFGVRRDRGGLRRGKRFAQIRERLGDVSVLVYQRGQAAVWGFDRGDQRCRVRGFVGAVKHDGRVLDGEAGDRPDEGEGRRQHRVHRCHRIAPGRSEDRGVRAGEGRAAKPGGGRWLENLWPSGIHVLADHPRRRRRFFRASGPACRTSRTVSS